MKVLFALSALFISSQLFAQTPSPGNHIVNNKKATYDYETGQGLLTLESYVTGEIKEMFFGKSTDVVLVLDVSNSMCPFNVGDSNKKETVNKRVYLFGGDQIGYLHQGTTATNDVSTVTNYTTNHDWKTAITIDGTTTLRYTIQLGGTGTMYNLAYFVKGTKYGGTSSSNTWNGDTGWYYGTTTTLTQNSAGTRWTKYTANSDDKIYTDVKLDLLENACRSLIDVVYDNPPISGSPHQISIVTYAQQSTPVFNLGLTAATEANKSTLINDVTFLTTAGNTYAKVGLDQAITNLSGSTASEKLLLFLTDGEPNNKFADIINSAKTLKDNGVKIYSIGLVQDETMNASRWNGENEMQIKTYLEYVSSLYPEAKGSIKSNKSTITPGTKNDDGKEYYTWSTGEDLADAFKRIGQFFAGGADVTDMNVSDGVNLNDKINNEFCVLAGADASLIKTYTADCTGKSSGVLTFDDPVSSTLTVTVDATSTPQSVKVEGFDFSDNWCGYDAENKKYHGKKLVVEIPFKMKAPGSDAITSATTNASGSSLYRNDDEIDGAGFTSPTIPFTELTIQKYGLKAGESAVYIVKKDGVEITRIILTGTSDTGAMVSTKLRILDPNADYSVTETWWDYTYTLTSSQVMDNVFTFNSKKKGGMKNTAEEQKVNDF